MLGKSPIKWGQRPDMTIAVDWDVKHQFKNVLYLNVPLICFIMHKLTMFSQNFTMVLNKHVNYGLLVFEDNALCKKSQVKDKK